MSEDSLFYREIAPAPEVSHLVFAFWEFLARSETDEPIVHEVFPEGCVSLIYKRNESFGIDALYIHGLTLEIFKTEVFAGDTFWAIRLTPSACAEILRRNPSQIQSQPLNESNDFRHLTAGLLEKLAACENLAEAIEIYESKLKSLAIEPEETDEKIAEAVKIVEENRGEVKISELAEAVGLSVRQLERRFKQSAGLSPKQYARARRIRAAAVSLVEEAGMNWAHRAAEMGFADQAHLTHEFSTLTGRTPNSFADKVRRITHGEILK